ncbi:hypothetical protein A5748_03930 [Nocardia sp. 852002-51244_SCH5132740]|nr:hypothetical protein A5748_03930 [Nocardia sp. 852002-51244_SCH5132740]
MPNFLGPWSQRAVCQKMGAFHLRPPVSRCSCGYRIVKTLDVLAEYWERHKGLWFPDTYPAVTRVLAAGRAQTYDQEHNLDRTNCLSVEYLRLAPGSTIYTPATEYADILRWRYPNNCIAVTDGVDFASIIETEAEPSRPLSAAGGPG